MAMNFYELEKIYLRLKRDNEMSTQRALEQKSKSAVAQKEKIPTAAEKELIERRAEMAEAKAELERKEKEDLNALKRKIPMETLHFKRRKRMAIRNDKDDKETEVPAVVSSTSEPTKEEVDWTQIRSMVEVETPKVPIAVHFPIIDWVWETDEKMRKYLKIVRAGDTVEKFMSFYRCIKALSRDDLDDMWSIAVRKYQNAQRHSDEHIVYNSLSILYEMDPENDFYKDTSRVKAWYCYSHNGVHMVQLHSGVFAYFFIGTEYPWNIGHLSSMLSLTMKSDDLDTAASLVHEIQQYYKKAQEKHVAQSEERRKKRIAELKKQFEQILK